MFSVSLFLVDETMETFLFHRLSCNKSEKKYRQSPRIWSPYDQRVVQNLRLPPHQIQRCGVVPAAASHLLHLEEGCGDEW